MSDAITEATAAGLRETEDRLSGAEADGAGAPVAIARRSPATAIGRRGYWIRRITLASDIAALTAALAITIGLVAALGRPAFDGADLLLFVASVPVWVFLANHFGLYHLPERTEDWSLADDLSSVFVVSSIWGWFLLLARGAVEPGPVDVLPSMALWVASIAIVPLFRSAVRSQLRTEEWYRQSVLLVGSPVGVDRVLRRIRRQPALVLRRRRDASHRSPLRCCGNDVHRRIARALARGRPRDRRRRPR